ncbi:MAG: hypothetical protein OHK0046_42160 [Anaerolineae bacterium]
MTLNVSLPVGAAVEDEAAIRRLVYAFADAANRRDIAQFSSVWVDGGIWKISPPINFELTGTAETIGSAFGNLISRWEFFIQSPLHGIVEVDANRARARWYTQEIARAATDGTGHFNYGLYLDELVRTSDGWRFFSRTYHYLYLDDSPLHGQGFAAPSLTGWGES